MRYRIVKHYWDGTYITDNMKYYTIQKRKVNIISVLKRLLFINDKWYEWVPIKDKKEPIHFNTHMDAYHCLLRVMSGEPVGDWKEEIIK
jgi:hypothetical protein